MKTVIPERTHGIVKRDFGHFCTYQGWPTVCIDEKGVLYAVASGYRSAHVCPFGKTVMYRSFDGGVTWSCPSIVNDTYLDDRDAGILYMGEGRMLLSWFNHPAELYRGKFYRSFGERCAVEEIAAAYGFMAGYEHLPDSEKRGGSYVRISTDYGFSWSDKIRLDGSAPHGPCICHNGSVIYLGKDMYKDKDEKDGSENKGEIWAYKSRDYGCTWETLGRVPLPEGKNECFCEPHVIELPDGRLFAAIRAQGEGIEAGSHDYKNTVISGYSIYTTESNDGGVTWTEPRPTGVSGAPAHLLLHSSGALIMSYGRREKPYGQRAAVSLDGGKSWKTEYIINDEGPDYDLGYPSTAELPDKSLITVYYQKYARDAKPSILYTKWRMS